MESGTVMPGSQPTALSWIKQIPRSLYVSDHIPLIGEPPPLPLKEWTEALKTSLGLKNLEIKTAVFHWTEENNFFQGIPNKKIFGFAIPGISGAFFFAVSSSHLSNVAVYLLTGEEKSPKILEQSVEEGFTRFLINEVLYSLKKSGQKEKFMPVFLETPPPLPKEPGLVMNIEVLFNEKSIPCRLILTKEFQTALSSECAPKLQDLYQSSPISKHVDIPVSFEVARLTMKRKEFQSINPGDFLVLKHCTLDPESQAGPILLKVFDLPFFSGQLKDGKITLAEVTQYYEAEADMQSENPEKDESEEFDFEDEELEDLEEFSEEELEELDEAKEEIEEEEEVEKDSSIEEGIEEPLEEQPPKTKEPPKEVPIAEKVPSKPSQETPKTAKELFNAGDIPLSLSVEIGRINISLNKLVELAPGNILEINMPREGVDLILNGKKVAQGELLKIGDVFGIRVMDIGS